MGCSNYWFIKGDIKTLQNVKVNLISMLTNCSGANLNIDTPWGTKLTTKLNIGQEITEINPNNKLENITIECDDTWCTWSWDNTRYLESANIIVCYNITIAPNLCEGVVCEDIYVGKDIWSQKCVEGNCEQDQLLEEYVEINPCEGVVCNDIYVGKDIWSQKCVEGNCIQDQLLEEYVEPNPCEGVVCEDYCDFVNHIMYSNGHCVNGKCVYDRIEENSVNCGYIENINTDENIIDEDTNTDEDTDEEEKTDMTPIYGIIGGVGIGLLLLLRNR